MKKTLYMLMAVIMIAGIAFAQDNANPRRDPLTWLE